MAARSDAIKGFVHVKDEKGLLGYHLQLSKNHFVDVLPPNHYLLSISSYIYVAKVDMQKIVKDLHSCWAGTRGSLHLTMSKVSEAIVAKWRKLKHL